MRVILLQDIKSLGKRGDVKSVADGYVRNFLIPKNLVKPATSAALKELESQKAKWGKQLQELKTEVLKVEEATAARPLVFSVKVGGKGEVFGSVRASDIKNNLLENHPQLKAADIEIGADHLKGLGKQEVKIKADKIEGKITIEVSPLP